MVSIVKCLVIWAAYLISMPKGMTTVSTVHRRWSQWVHGRLTDTHGYISEARESTLVESGSLESPSLVGIVQVRLSIMTDRVSILVDDDCRVEVLRGSRPPMRNVYFFWIANNQFCIILESSGSGPNRSNASTSRLEERGDIAQRREIVT